MRLSSENTDCYPILRNSNTKDKCGEIIIFFKKVIFVCLKPTADIWLSYVGTQNLVGGIWKHYELCIMVGKEILWKYLKTVNLLNSCIQQLGNRLQDPEALWQFCTL